VKSKKQVSNRAIFALIIAVAVVTIISTYFIVDAAMSVSAPEGDVEEATAHATITIEGNEEVAIETVGVSEAAATASVTIE